MPEMELDYIQTPEGTDAPAMDADEMPFGAEWRRLHAEECGCVVPWQSCDADRRASRNRYGGYIPYDEF